MLVFWLLAPGPLRSSPPLHRLPPVRQDFLDSIGDLPIEATGALRTRIGQAHSLRDLWHLRAELYHVLALNRDQREAEQRLRLAASVFDHAHEGLHGAQSVQFPSSCAGIISMVEQSMSPARVCLLTRPA